MMNNFNPNVEFELRHSPLKKTLIKLTRKFLNEKLKWLEENLKTPVPEEKTIKNKQHEIKGEINFDETSEVEK